MARARAEIAKADLRRAADVALEKGVAIRIIKSEGRTEIIIEREAPKVSEPDSSEWDDV